MAELSKEQKREIAAAKKAAREAAQVAAREKYLREQAEQFAAATVNYKDRLLTVIIEYATIEDFSIDRNESLFPGKLLLNHYARNGDYDKRLTITVVPKIMDDLYNLEEAEAEVKAYYERVAEEKRIEAIRVTARAKLTDEEAKALGLR